MCTHTYIPHVVIITIILFYNRRCCICKTAAFHPGLDTRARTHTRMHTRTHVRTHAHTRTLAHTQFLVPIAHCTLCNQWHDYSIGMVTSHVLYVGIHMRLHHYSNTAIMWIIAVWLAIMKQLYNCQVLRLYLLYVIEWQLYLRNWMVIITNSVVVTA